MIRYKKANAVVVLRSCSTLLSHDHLINMNIELISIINAHMHMSMFPETTKYIGVPTFSTKSAINKTSNANN